MDFFCSGISSAPINQPGIAIINRMRGETIIMVEGGSIKGIKQRHRQLAERFARDNEVIYIDEPGNILTVFISNEKPISNLWSWISGLIKQGENFYSWTPPPGLPFGYIFPWINKWNHFWYKIWYSLLCGKKPKEPVLIISNVLGNEWMDYFGEKLRIYDCCDEITGFFVPRMRPDVVRREEKKLIESCDIVICSSPKIFESKSAMAKRSALVRNGADVAHFRKALDGNLPKPESMKNIDKPIVGFFGYLGDWLDWDIINYCIRNAPEYHFFMIGPTAYSITPSIEAENVTYTGARHYETLPQYLAHFDCGIIPFTVNEFSRNFNPVKSYEYLAGGCPSIGTPIPELLLFGDNLYFGDDGPSFLAAIRRAIAEDTPEKRKARSESVVKEDWDNRIEEFYKAIEDLGD